VNSNSDKAANRDRITLVTARFANSIASFTPAHVLDKALEARDFYSFLAVLFTNAPVSSDSDARLREQQLNAARFKREMAEAAGGLLDVADVAKLLHYQTPQAVYKAVRERRLLSVEDAGRMRFPGCQFADGAPIPGLKDVLGAAPSTTGWRMLQYLLIAEEGLGGGRPLDLLATGKAEDREIVLRFARRLEE
jgi:hypothetical protein